VRPSDFLVAVPYGHQSAQSVRERGPDLELPVLHATAGWAFSRSHEFRGRTGGRWWLVHLSW
jgi:hypothetical protein